MIKEILTTILLSGSLAFGGVSQEMQSPKMSIYNDNDFSVLLNSDELTDFVFDNFNEFLTDYSLTTFSNTFSLSYGYNGVSFDDFYLDDGYTCMYLLDDDNAYFTLTFNCDFSYVTLDDNKFHIYDDTGSEDKFLSSLLITASNENDYYLLKNAIQLDIQENQPSPTDSLYDLVYDYFHDVVFNTESLDDYEFELFSQTITMRSWLAHTASLVFIISVVILFISFIIMLVKMIGALFYNFGR